LTGSTKYTVRQIEVTELCSNVWLLVGEDKQAIAIDAGDSSPVLRVLEETGASLAQILNTHGHADHILGNAHLREVTGAPIAIHEADAAMLSDPLLSLAAWAQTEQTLHQADQLLKDGEVVKTCLGDFEVLHTPGHSPGQVCFVDHATKRIFSGDLLFRGSVGRTDLPGSDPDAQDRSLRRIAKLPPDYTVYPGHGPATTIGQELRSNPYLLDAMTGYAS
jgi:hydroxyacylglutathione hydrolase